MLPPLIAGFKLKCVQPAAKPIMLLRKYSWNLAKTPFFIRRKPPMRSHNEMRLAGFLFFFFSAAQYIKK